MKIGVPGETASGERRVALAPETVARLTRAGHSVQVAAGAGVASGFPDAAYEAAGATVSADTAAVISSAEILAHVQPPDEQVISSMAPGTVLISMLEARTDPEGLKRLAAAGVSGLAMELVPRIARAQRMDVLSSQASIAGYKAVLIGANMLGKYFPMMMTAAGTVPPARVLVLGAGVAGLQAIATAKRLGSVVEAYDVRPVVKEQVQSLGGIFIELPAARDAETAGGYAREQTAEEQAAQRQLLADHVASADVVITTAAIPGRPAPKLVMADMVARMSAGSVIVDLAAETGGNCELTKAGEVVLTENGVSVYGPVNVPSMVPTDGSRLYSRNIAALLELLLDKEGKVNLNFEDEIISAMCVTHKGEVRFKG
ncbi:MAG: Re/Si-specific NAD(P)(+) transhydrogenase subunit alpha [Chloroflexi bacterium]|nr:Re/Si-specific NAD(P)(+) transhydrogenase subunit alpha [Chloroflexota bacterium]